MNITNVQLLTKLVICSLIILHVLASCKPEEEFTDLESPDSIALLLSEDLFSYSDFKILDTKAAYGIHYAEVATAFGIARYSGLVNNSELIERVSDRYYRVIEENINNSANHVDVNVYGALPLELYRHTRDKVLFDQGIVLADTQWVKPLSNGLTRQTRFWADDVWMISILQVQAFRTTDNEVYLDRAATQISAYIDRLQQENGLFYHGKSTPFYWGRGNGWVAAGITELLIELPQDHALYDKIKTAYIKFMNALLAYQAEDGMWRQIITEQVAWKETSSTAMFGYSFVEGTKLGLLEEEKFKPAYEKAWEGLKKYITEKGKVTDVCSGTGKGEDLEYYLNRPRVTGDFHGQAPVIWFATSLID